MTNLAGTGRLYKADKGDLEHLVTPRSAVGIDRKLWHSPGVLDQDGTPRCVGYAGKKWLLSGPTINLRFSPKQLYDGAQANDDIPGTNYEGSTVRGLFKFLKKEGYIEEYQWAFSVDPIRNQLKTVGTMVLGTDWFPDMFMPDKYGFVTFENAVGREGHAYCAIGVDDNKYHKITGDTGAILCAQSYGRNWGPLNGRFWMSYRTLNLLLRRAGEACIGKELKK